MSAAREYAEWVLLPGNEVKTGKLIKQAAQRFLSDLKRTDVYFNEEEAVKMVNFGERYCNQWEGDWRGKPVKFEPWQRFIFEQLFGWIRKDTGTRRFTKLYIQIAKKNGKSTMCAVLALFHLFADERVNTPKVFTAANNEDQAKICVNMSGRIIEQSEVLNDFVLDGQVKLSTYGKNITEVIHKEKDGFITALSKEGGDKKAKTAGGKHGINASLGLVDEFGMSPDHGASGSIYTSMAARMERLMAYLTTSGFNKLGPCYTELRDQGIKVLSGALEMDNYLPVIFELDSPLDESGKEQKITIDYLLERPEVWAQCNPNIGISVNKEYLHEMLKNARSLGGMTEVDVKTLNFNMWCDAPTVWIQDDVWKQNVHGTELKDLEGLECFGGLYTASSKSVNNFILFFPNFKDNLNAFVCWSWLPEDSILTNEDNVDYQKWIDGEYIIKTPNNSADHKKMAVDVIEICQKYDVRVVGFDKTFGQYVAPELEAEGIAVMEIYQGFNNLAQQTTEFKKLADSKLIEHFNNPILRWHLGNTVTHRNGEGLEKPDKEASGSRTGAVSAILNAMVARFEYYKEGGMDSFTFSSLGK